MPSAGALRLRWTGLFLWFQLAAWETSANIRFSPGALPFKPCRSFSSVEGGIRAAHQRGECDRQDLGVSYSGPRRGRPMRTPAESHQGYALVAGERTSRSFNNLQTDSLRCQCEAAAFRSARTRQFKGCPELLLQPNLEQRFLPKHGRGH